jgi:hypothetical protein
MTRERLKRRIQELNLSIGELRDGMAVETEIGFQCDACQTLSSMVALRSRLIEDYLQTRRGA